MLSLIGNGLECRDMIHHDPGARDIICLNGSINIHHAAIIDGGMSPTLSSVPTFAVKPIRFHT